jgi:hypothetical protein
MQKPSQPMMKVMNCKVLTNIGQAFTKVCLVPTFLHVLSSVFFFLQIL